MTDEELNQWAYAIDAALKGEYLTYEYRTQNEARYDFTLVRDIMDAIGLVHDAYSTPSQMRVEFDEGGIRFCTGHVLNRFRGNRFYE